MSTTLKNLSDHGPTQVPSAAGMRFALLVAEWNTEITESLAKAATTTLLKYGANEEDILCKHVPGSFELTLGAQLLAEQEDVDAVICLGCVIQGETKHFDFICNAVANGITEVGLKYNKPVIFGVLTTNTLVQAQERAGGKHGNKGDEAAVTAIKMITLQRSLHDLSL